MQSNLSTVIGEEISKLSFMPQCILFDYDRTIAEVPIDWLTNRQPFHDYLHHHFPRINLPSGLRIDEMEEVALTQFPQQADTIFDFRRKLEGAVKGVHIPDFDVVELILSLGQPPNSRRLFIISNNLHSTIEEGLRSIDIFDHFEAILAVDDVGIPKPSPRAAEILQTLYRVELGQSMLIGDSPSTDGEFCLRVGIPYFNVKTLTMHYR